MSSVSKMHCDIYRSSKKDEMYLYIARPDYSAESDSSELDPLEIVPEVLRHAFGRATFVMHLELSETRRLARVLHVLDSLQTKGFLFKCLQKV